VSHIFGTAQGQVLQLGYSVKTKIQQRALAGDTPRTVRETFHRLIRGEHIISNPFPFIA
jgi:hypothetical protein